MKKICPYHTRETGDCRMTAGGLYLPLTHHIETYCLTERYVSCQHFVKGKGFLEKTSAAVQLCRESGRRRFARAQERFQLILKSCDTHGNPLETVGLEAFTVDLSQGGIRIESDKKFSVSSYIRFAFQKDFLIPELEGTGQIRWSVPKENSDYFEAGVAFTDARTQSLVGAQLGGYQIS